MISQIASKTGRRTALVAAGLVLAVASPAHADVVYSSIPTVLPSNLPSLGYQATSTSEFGDHIALAAGARDLQSVTIAMSDWAIASQYGSSDPGYYVNLTLNLYQYTGDSAAGPLLASLTQNTLIPWRPEASANCTGGAWQDPTGACYNGLAFNVTFDFSALGVVLPDDLVVGLAFDTQSYGSNPTGADGPYNSLNFALSGGTTVGADANPDGVFWNTSNASFLTTGTAGVFGQDTSWTGYVPAIQVDASSAVPEPGSLALVAIALAGALAPKRRRN